MESSGKPQMSMMWSMIDLAERRVNTGIVENLSLLFVILFYINLRLQHKFDGLQLVALNFPVGVGDNLARFGTLPSCLTNS
jgi:hypothetical protein